MQVVLHPTAKYSSTSLSLMGLPVSSGHDGEPLVVMDQPSKAVIEVRLHPCTSRRLHSAKSRVERSCASRAHFVRTEQHPHDGGVAVRQARMAQCALMERSAINAPVWVGRGDGGRPPLPLGSRSLPLSPL